MLYSGLYYQRRIPMLKIETYFCYIPELFVCPGTPTYMAPEVLRVFQSYSFPADIWSLGALISFICNGKHLFMSHYDAFVWGIQV